MRPSKTLLFRLIPLVTMLGVVVGLLLWWSSIGQREQAIDFRLPTLDGEWVSLSALQGEPVLFTFFLSRCPDCNRETAYFNDIYENYRESHSLNVLGIGIGEEIEEFAERNAVLYPVLLDTSMEVARAYGVSRVPHTVLVDRQGRVAASYSTPLSYEELNDALQMIL